MTYIGENAWHQAKYKDEEGRIYVDVDMAEDPRKPLSLHTVTQDYGEPDLPANFDEVEVVGWSDEKQMQKKFRFHYMRLSSLQMKANDFISSYNESGIDEARASLNRHWHKTPELLSKEMHEEFNMLPVKPDWCTSEYLERFDKIISKKQP